MFGRRWCHVERWFEDCILPGGEEVLRTLLVFGERDRGVREVLRGNIMVKGLNVCRRTSGDSWDGLDMREVYDFVRAVLVSKSSHM